MVFYTILEVRLFNSLCNWRGVLEKVLSLRVENELY
jgi:hypothetical protein